MKMKKILLLLIVVLALNVKAQYPSLNIALTATLNPETNLGWYGNGTKYSSVYGWANPVDNKEYAILGGASGTYFIEVTNPSAPVVRDFVPATPNDALWREYRTSGNYVYMVSDDGGSKLQIADMSYLPDSVNVVVNSNAIFSRSHTVFVEGNKLWCGSVTKVSPNAFYTMAVYDISNPVNPILLRTLNQDYPAIGHVHDMYVRNDTVYASCGNDKLHIYKYNGVFTEIGAVTTYPQSGYNHSSDLTPDGKHLVFVDEVGAGLKVKLLDVSDMNNLTIADTSRSNPGATPHNVYMVDNTKVIISYYADGVYIFDFTNPSNMVPIAFFDTEPTSGPSNNYSPNTYRGCWGAYPYLPSGILLASDMQTGLFILDASAVLGLTTPPTLSNSYTLFPNPAKDLVNLNIVSTKDDNVTVEIFDITGKLVLQQKIDVQPTINRYYFNVENLANGSYIIKAQGTHINIADKIILSK